MNRQLQEVVATGGNGVPHVSDPAHSADPVTLEGRLWECALNLWWAWHPRMIELFRDLDPVAWEASNHNPVALLRGIPANELAERVRVRALENRINFQYRRLQEYLTTEPTWCADRAGALGVSPVAYFCAEFGLHESLPLYSGGLGVLAGDYLKSASDIGLPVVGVGLFYANGYFRQRLDANGWQQEEYGTTDIELLPIRRAVGHDHAVLTVNVQCGHEALRAAVWLAHVGRALLILLDSDIEPNPPHLRQLTARLYGGDEVTRIRQEILLGIGGLRALRAIGIRSAVLHLNEGHSAFAILERMREYIQDDGVDFEEALYRTAARTVFTTHTPVEAGTDRFAPDLVERELGWLRGALGVDQRTLLSLGRTNASDPAEPFVMTILAFRGSEHRNAVSSLHGRVSRRIWRNVWPGRGQEEVPIRHVTNGVHVRSWLSPSMDRIYDRHLGSDWPSRQSSADTWRLLSDVYDGELWETHAVLRRYLVDFTRRRTGTPDILDPRALTIGFARRFATYKRATLVLSDPDRLARLLGNPMRPVQLIFAGKAHPKDEGGKKYIQEIITLSHDPRFTGRLVFIEDYDVNIARHLVQGVDVWLNTPLRPLEASGTSGQKVVLNGGLNLSILDGWWAEAYDGENGFAIGSDNLHADPVVQWQRDARSLYETLEREVIPMFYEVDTTGLPRRWIARMKHSIMSLAWRYNADRMVTDYVTSSYLPAAGLLCSG